MYVELPITPPDMMPILLSEITFADFFVPASICLPILIPAKIPPVRPKYPPNLPQCAKIFDPKMPFF